MNRYLIYRAENRINGKCYIGFTSLRLSRRKISHKHFALKKNSQVLFHRAIRKYGWDNFQWEVLFISWDRDYCLNVAEQAIMDDYDALAGGYNLEKGGGKGPICLGSTNGMYGKTHTEEVKNNQANKAREQFKGKSYVELYGAARAIELKEQRAKRLIQTRKEHRERDSTVYIFSHKGGEIFEGTKETFSLYSSLPFSRVTSIIFKLRQSYKGWSVTQ